MTWIRVEDSLPPGGKEILIYGIPCSFNHQTILVGHRGSRGYFDLNCEEVNHVDMWHEIPELPEGTRCIKFMS